MFGRFSFAYEDWSEVQDYFGLMNLDFVYPQRYNIAPSHDIPAIISDGRNRRRIGTLRWGLIPSWSDSENTSFTAINARAETLLMAPSFRNLVSRKRCVIPATGFYEWQRNTRKPHNIYPLGRKLFGFAGLYDTWQASDGRKVSSCTIITCQPNLFMSTRALHDRMPVILTRDDEDIWLDRTVTNSETVMSLLRPYGGEMDAYEVDEAVGNAKNNHRLLLTRAHSEQQGRMAFHT